MLNEDTQIRFSAWLDQACLNPARMLKNGNFSTVFSDANQY